jgi:hypothetical protein
MEIGEISSLVFVLSIQVLFMCLFFIAFDADRASRMRMVNLLLAARVRPLGKVDSAELSDILEKEAERIWEKEGKRFWTVRTIVKLHAKWQERKAKKETVDAHRDLHKEAELIIQPEND